MTQKMHLSYQSKLTHHGVGLDMYTPAGQRGFPNTPRKKKHPGNPGNLILKKTMSFNVSEPFLKASLIVFFNAI